MDNLIILTPIQTVTITVPVRVNMQSELSLLDGLVYPFSQTLKDSDISICGEYILDNNPPPKIRVSKSPYYITAINFFGDGDIQATIDWFRFDDSFKNLYDDFIENPTKYVFKPRLGVGFTGNVYWKTIDMYPVK